MTTQSATQGIAPKDKAVIGTFFHAPAPDRLDALEDVMMIIDSAGSIKAIIASDDPDRRAMEAKVGQLLRLPTGTYDLPGMVDLHVHAPQYLQLGLTLDEPL
ncbi:MAG: hypothetical protein MO852_02010 [Candidatus Devosia euplotis]|nr:hypothetical protein [Candidatus Devosia euplotis]